MSITGRIKETTEKLKGKLKTHKDAARAEARYQTSESQRVAKDVKDEARYETSEGERIAKDLREKAEQKTTEAKERFSKH